MLYLFNFSIKVLIISENYLCIFSVGKRDSVVSGTSVYYDADGDGSGDQTNHRNTMYYDT